MKLVMIGTGYVGLVSGVCFAELGHEVVCQDVDAAKVARLRAGEVPIYEPGLEDLLTRNAAAGRLSFTEDLEEAMEGVEAVFIAVGTPSRRGDGAADLSYVEAAARSVAALARVPLVVVTKSTVPVGTNRWLMGIFAEAAPEAEIDIVSNPEFLREGAAIGDFLRPDRVVIGSESAHAREVMDRIYRPLSLREAPIQHTGLESAEMIKYAANAFLAMKITFINEIADLCERVGADVQAVASGIGRDGRIGPKFLHPGPGYGGSCFPKDTQALAAAGRTHAAPQRLVETVIEVNAARKRAMVDRVRALCGDRLAGQRVAVFGVTFKPETDDMRDSPSLTVVPALVGAGAEVHVVDPEGRREGMALLPGVHWHDDPYAAAEGAGAVVVLTEWNAFRGLDLARLAAVMDTPRLADLRNVYDPAEARAAGFDYVSVGRP